MLTYHRIGDLSNVQPEIERCSADTQQRGKFVGCNQRSRVQRGKHSAKILHKRPVGRTVGFKILDGPSC